MAKDLFGWNLEYSYQSLPKQLFQLGKASSYPSSELVLYNENLAQELGLKTSVDNQEVGYFLGSHFPSGSQPIHQGYGGHQFGYFNILGDGRAILLGEQITPKGKRFDIQLKGSGQSPYSRGGDGKAAFGPMLREYIISEAMASLRIPTTRSLAVVKTGEHIARESILEGAILTRVASSHIRVGTFQYAALLGQDTVKALADYAIQRHYPHLIDGEYKYLHFLEAVLQRQAQLVAMWQSVGFIHGVMNTDNITISGETIDYGPCAFMNEFDPNTVFSSIDTGGRYRYGNQSVMAQWAMARLAETMLFLFDEKEEKALEKAKKIVDQFPIYFNDYWLQIMKNKLGLIGENDRDEELITQLFTLMGKYKADFTNTFIRLTLLLSSKENEMLKGTDTLFESEEFKVWKDTWLKCVLNFKVSEKERFDLMRNHNPYVIPRNFHVENVLKSATVMEDLEPLKALVKVLQNPFDYNQNRSFYQNVPQMKNYQTFCGT